MRSVPSVPPGTPGEADAAPPPAASGGAPGAAGGRVAVKICGVTDPASAVLSAELGAAFLGLNFWPGSPRRLDLGLAREIAAAARAAAPGVTLVGVFVHPTTAVIEAADRAVGLDLLQFSGDEPPAAVAPYAARALKTLRLEAATATTAMAAMSAMTVQAEAAATTVLAEINAPAAGMRDPLAGFESCWGVLLDTPRAGGGGGGGSGDGGAAGGGEYGGTGRAWDYAAARAWLPAWERRRVFLAGGLGPANVRSVLERLRPFAVDVCSGVESAPGKKDPQLLRRLFEEVLHAQVTTAT